MTSQGQNQQEESDGIPAPNYTQIPNKLLDQWVRAMGEAELKIVLAIARKTFGWHKVRDDISYSQLQEFTGLTVKSIRAGVEAAIKRGIVERYSITTEKGPGYAYRLRIIDNPELSTEVINKNVDNSGKGDTKYHSTMIPSITVPCYLVSPQKKDLNKELNKTSSQIVDNSQVTNAPPTRPPNPFLSVYEEFFGTLPDTKIVTDLVSQLKDLSGWREACRYWSERGHKPTNIAGLIDRYKKISQPAQLPTRPAPPAKRDNVLVDLSKFAPGGKYYHIATPNPAGLKPVDPWDEQPHAISQ